MNEEIAKKLIKRGKEIFLEPGELYSYEEIILGSKVQDKKEFTAVSSNSFISYKFKGESNKILRIYKDYFIKGKNKILKNLKQIRTREELDKYEDLIRSELLDMLKKEDFKTKVNLNSYNRTRKIVDLIIEHIACMCIDLSNVRSVLSPLLFLPLDSQMFSNEEIFSTEELRSCGLSRRSKYGELKNKEDYDKLQDLLIKKSNQFPGFSRIYFDLLWGKKLPRYKSCGNNLFQTNLGIPLEDS